MDIKRIKTIEGFGIISETTEKVTLELNLIKYEDCKDCFDLRRWKTTADGTKEPLEGLEMTADELETLQGIFDCMVII